MTDFTFVSNCRKCGGYLAASSRMFVCCPSCPDTRLFPRCRGYGVKMRRLVRRKLVDSLPKATKLKGKRNGRTVYEINGEQFVSSRNKNDADVKQALLGSNVRRFEKVST